MLICIEKMVLCDNNVLHCLFFLVHNKVVIKRKVLLMH